MRDSITWRVEYHDGTVLNQYEGDEKFFYKDIDRTKGFNFFLMDNFGKPKFVAAFDEGEGGKLIWRLRVKRQGDLVLNLHIVGKKGRYVALVSEGNPVSIMDNFDESHALLSAPQPADGET